MKMTPEPTSTRIPQKNFRDTGSYNPGHLPTHEQHERYKYIGKAHVESFNFMLNAGLMRAVEDLQPIYFNHTPNEDDDSNEHFPELKFWFENLTLAAPTMSPAECRIRGVNYESSMAADLCVQLVNYDDSDCSMDSNVFRMRRKLGSMPLMVMCDLCPLSKCSPSKLVQKGEDSCEFGGYFIINGAERLIRLLQVPRRNFPLGLQRSSFQKRGNTYSDLGVMFRSARYSGCQTTTTNVFHYLEGGMVTIRLAIRKQEFLVPAYIVMKSLLPGLTDEQIYNDLLSLCRLPEHVEMFRPYILLLTQMCSVSAAGAAEESNTSSSNFQINTQEECKFYLGSRFRLILQQTNAISSDMTDIGKLDRRNPFNAFSLFYYSIGCFI